MDPLTQGMLGAVAGQLVAGHRLPRAAGAVGFAAGVLADIDVFFHVSPDPVRTIVMHRHFTHALAFAPLGGLFAAGMVLWLTRLRDVKGVVLAAVAGYLTHGLLDACTSFGTLLWWPIAHERVAWDLIAVIDPLFTLPLVVGTLVAWGLRRRSPAAVGLVLALGYLGWAATAHAEALDAQRALAAQRGHHIERGRAMATLGNAVIWRSLYEADGRLWTDTVRVTPAGVTVREGASLPRLDIDDVLTGHPEVDRSLRLFAWFADGWLARVEGRPTWAGDMRYSLRAGAFQPLWAVTVDAGRVRLTDPAWNVSRRGAMADLWHDIAHGLHEPRQALGSNHGATQSTE